MEITKSNSVVGPAECSHCHQRAKWIIVNKRQTAYGRSSYTPGTTTTTTTQKTDYNIVKGALGASVLGPVGAVAGISKKTETNTVHTPGTRTQISYDKWEVQLKCEKCSQLTVCTRGKASFDIVVDAKHFYSGNSKCPNCGSSYLDSVGVSGLQTSPGPDWGKWENMYMCSSCKVVTKVQEELMSSGAELIAVLGMDYSDEAIMFFHENTVDSSGTVGSSKDQCVLVRPNYGTNSNRPLVVPIPPYEPKYTYLAHSTWAKWHENRGAMQQQSKSTIISHMVVHGTYEKWRIEQSECLKGLWKKHGDYIVVDWSSVKNEEQLNDIMKVLRSFTTSSNQFSNTVQNTSTSGSQGCYVATAVYGSYDCPQVWTLRRFRDSILSRYWYGRMFIRVYYAISPSLVRWFGNKKWFTMLWKGTLDKMVSKLNKQGIEDSPYQDMDW